MARAPVDPEKSRKGKASRGKGKRGELELAKLLTALGFPAIRAQQYKGGAHSGDLICPELTRRGIHPESKRVETAQISEWAKQAARDGTGMMPAIFWRQSARKPGQEAPPWLVILRVDDFVNILQGGTTPNRLDLKDLTDG